MSAEPRNSTVTYPGGLRARWRWAGSGEGAAVFALSEVGGRLVELGTRVTDDPEPLCRAELRLDGPRGAWTARFASRMVARRSRTSTAARRSASATRSSRSSGAAPRACAASRAMSSPSWVTERVLTRWFSAVNDRAWTTQL